MASAQALAVTLKALSAAFSREVTADTVEAYKVGVGDLRDDELQQAAAQAIRTCLRFPIPAELRALAGKGGARALKAEAAAAWERVQAALGSLGEDGGADFGPIANAVVRNLGGWSQLWHEPFRALPFTRRKFEELYEAFAESPPSPERCSPILPRNDGRYGSYLPPGAKSTPHVIPGATSPIVRELAEAKS